jgi:hypothetical protein
MEDQLDDIRVTLSLHRLTGNSTFGEEPAFQERRELGQIGKFLSNKNL